MHDNQVHHGNKEIKRVMNRDIEEFNYTYTALSDSERRMVESIRSEYLQPCGNQSMLNQLVALDKKVKNIPKSLSILLGIVGLMIFGLGMSMSLVWDMLIGGVAVSILGAAIMAAVYPINKALVKLLKSKYSAEILAITSEMLDDIAIAKAETKALAKL